MGSTRIFWIAIDDDHVGRTNLKTYFYLGKLFLKYNISNKYMSYYLSIKRMKTLPIQVLYFVLAPDIGYGHMGTIDDYTF